MTFHAAAILLILSQDITSCQYVSSNFNVLSITNNPLISFITF